MNAKNTRLTTVVALAGALLIAGAAQAALVEIKVNAKIAGKGKPQHIGTVKADGGFLGKPSGMNAVFTFEKGYGYLDDTYDFDWLNICTAEKGDSGLFAKKPAFDPQPDPVVKGEDKIPFYYNDGEWTANKFSGEKIHDKGKSSQFIDFPKLPKDQGFEFSAFLAIRDDGKYTLDGKTKTCILAGWTWKYEGDDKFAPPATNGTSTAIASIAIDDKVVKLFADCVTNNDAFKGWSAVIGCELPKNVPVPGSIALLALGGLVAARRRR